MSTFVRMSNILATLATIIVQVIVGWVIAGLCSAGIICLSHMLHIDKPHTVLLRLA